MKWLKIIAGLTIAVILLMILTGNPTGAAHLVNHIASGLGGFAQNLSKFAGRLKL